MNCLICGLLVSGHLGKRKVMGKSFVAPLDAGWLTCTTSKLRYIHFVVINIENVAGKKYVR